MFHKGYIGLLSAWKIFITKIQVTWINSIRGAFRIEILYEGHISIGHFLMSRGLLYLKSASKGKLTIGDNVFFNHNCSITCAESIVIGNYCIFSNNLVIIDHDHEIGENGVTETLASSPIVIEDSVWCGANVTITKGVHIGTGAVIAANAVVVSDVEAHTIVAGVLAKRIK